MVLSDTRLRTPYTNWRNMVIVAQFVAPAHIPSTPLFDCSIVRTILCRDMLRHNTPCRNMPCPQIARLCRHHWRIFAGPVFSYAISFFSVLRYQPIRVRVLQVRDCSNPPHISGTPPSAAAFLLCTRWCAARTLWPRPLASGHT